MNASWHDELESAATVDETVASVRRYLGTLPPQQVESLPRCCRPNRIKADDDIDDLTMKLAQAQREPLRCAGDGAVLHEVFDFFLHASLRISQLNRIRANGTTFVWRFPRRQMA